MQDNRQLFARCTFLLMLVCVFAGPVLSAVKPSTKAPNIMVIFPDQYRSSAMSFWSQPEYAAHLVGMPDPVKTPNIDKLAKDGIVFTQAVSNFPVCSPYRGMLMSGRYPEQNGLWANCHRSRIVELRHETECLTDVYYQAGYNTAYFGKCHWHRNEALFDANRNYVGTTMPPGGHFANSYDTYVPPGRSRHSIEYFVQSLRDTHFDPICYSNIPAAVGGKADGQAYLPKRYTPKLESEWVIDYLQNRQGQRNANKPFCLLWSLNPPHNPWDENNTDVESYERNYKDKSLDELLVRENVQPGRGDYAPFYFANVTGVDRYVGKVLDALEAEGLADNTIVVFTADHGEMLGSHGRSGKLVIEREAFSIPLIVRWPKKLKHRIDDLLISVPDMMPTLLGLTGLQAKIPHGVTGKNYAQLFVNPESVTEKPRSSLYFSYHERGLYTGRYSLLVAHQHRQKDYSFESYIYDNQADPYQKKKIPLSDMPEVSQKLLKELGMKLKEIDDCWYRTKLGQTVIPYPSAAKR